MTPLTSEMESRTITNSAEVTFGGAFQYELYEPESKGASNDKTGAESAAVSTYNYTEPCHLFIVNYKNNKMEDFCKLDDQTVIKRSIFQLHFSEKSS